MTLYALVAILLHSSLAKDFSLDQFPPYFIQSLCFGITLFSPSKASLHYYYHIFFKVYRLQQRYLKSKETAFVLYWTMLHYCCEKWLHPVEDMVYYLRCSFTEDAIPNITYTLVKFQYSTTGLFFLVSEHFKSSFISNINQILKLSVLCTFFHVLLSKAGELILQSNYNFGVSNIQLVPQWETFICK